MAAPDDGAHPAVALRSRLPRMSAREAARRNVLVAALNGARCEGGRLSARVASAPAALPTLRCRGGFGLAPAVVEGRPAAWVEAPESPHLPEALLELAALEPLIAAAERALGVALEPELMAAGPPEGAVAVRLSRRGPDGAEEDALLLCVADGASLTPAPPPARVAAHGPAARARVACRLELAGPAAPVGELGWLATGDLILAGDGARGLRARLSTPGGAEAHGRWRCGEDRFICEGGLDDVTDADDGAAAGDLPGEMRVRLSFELGPVEIPLGQLARLAPGVVLPTPSAGDAPLVTVCAGGARIATGRLVAVGDAYGVLVEAVGGDRAAPEGAVTADGTERP